MDFASCKKSQICLLEQIVHYMEKTGKYPFYNSETLDEFIGELLVPVSVDELRQQFKTLSDSFFHTIHESACLRFPCEESRKVFRLSSQVWGHPNEIASYGFFDDKKVRKDKFLQELSTDVDNQISFLQSVVDFNKKFRRYPDYDDFYFSIFRGEWLEVDLWKGEYLEQMKILKEKFRKTRRNYYDMLHDLDENSKKFFHVGDEIWGEKCTSPESNTKSKAPVNSNIGETSVVTTSSSGSSITTTSSSSSSSS